MKYLLFIVLVFLLSCAHRPAKKEEDLVSLGAALMQAQASYLKGCVDALKLIKVPLAFHGCRDMSILHRQELDEIMDQPIQ
ncbi:MAG: hypothetical protein ACLGHN_07300 [Bacteriovoracia bacterium]